MNSDFNDVHDIHKHIIQLYKKDFAKYQNNDKKLKLMSAYDLIPEELNKQNKRYVLKDLNEYFKFDRYESSFEWFYAAELAIPIYNVSSPELPLLPNSKSSLFKLFLNDVGLLCSMYGKPTIKNILQGKTNLNYGAIYENFVAQELHAHGYPGYYYKSKKFGEIDFVIEDNCACLPIEVKSGKDYLRHSALDNIMSNKTYNIEQAYVFTNTDLSAENIATLEWKSKNFKIKDEYKLLYLPVYMAMFINQDDIDLNLV